MLGLQLKAGDRVTIGDSIVLYCRKPRGESMRLVIEAPGLLIRREVAQDITYSVHPPDNHG